MTNMRPPADDQRLERYLSTYVRRRRIRRGIRRLVQGALVIGVIGGIVLATVTYVRGCETRRRHADAAEPLVAQVANPM